MEALAAGAAAVVVRPAVLPKRKAMVSAIKPGRRGVRLPSSKVVHLQRCCAMEDEAEGAVAAEELTVVFLPEEVYTTARAGENIMEVAERCGIQVPHSCMQGYCGTCELEVTKHTADDANSHAQTSSPVVVRSCIAAIPSGYKRVVVSAIEDPYWGGGDGWM
eukprot:jgi/Chlat1/8011/Chrsp7S07758